jgi:hypothetical protein
MAFYIVEVGQGAHNAALAPHPCTLQSSCRTSYPAVSSATLRECHPTPQRFNRLDGSRALVLWPVMKNPVGSLRRRAPVQG